MNPAGEWCLIESDPGVFTALIKDFGVKGLQVEEVVTLEKESFNRLEPIYGCIFLFKCIAETVTEGELVQDGRVDEIFFAQQVISNACATQAIVSILMNLVAKNNSKIQLGSALTEFKDFTASFTPALKGVSLSNSDHIRQVHNSFARQQVFEYSDSRQPKSEDNYHFIAYMPINGRLYELDGLKPAPIDHGKTDDWLEKLREVVHKRIGNYSANEISFNLMAVVGDQKELIQDKLQDLNKQMEQMQTDNGKDKFLRTEMVRSEIEFYENRLRSEDEKRRGYERENIRRKHNYLPFIIEMLRILADNHQLLPLVDAAKSKQKQKQLRKSSKRQPPAHSSVS